jgi:mannan endo-1,4-beta-mannosidase
VRLRALFVGLLLPAALAAAPPSPFVRAAGADFVVDGRPFSFVGANFDAIQGIRNRARYRATIAALAHDELRVGRVWAFGEGPRDAKDWYLQDNLFRAGPDGYIEEAYQMLDRVLAAARADGIRVIVVLSNHWSNYGGIPMYLRWAGLPEANVEAFYRDERVRALYKSGVEKLLTRVNHVTGVAYADDPTIFSWELMNESSVETPEAAAARYAWIVEMARFVKQRDRHHLVGAGLAGYTTLAERAEWIRVHKLPEIDYCDSHLYPQTTDQVDSWQRLADRIDDRAQLARFAIGKPLLFGEIGFRTDQKTKKEGWLGQPRAAWYERVLDRMAQDGVAGALAWIYQPWPDFPRDFGIYVDRADTDDVRRALATRAARLARGAPAGRNPRLGPAQGERPLYETKMTLRGPGTRAKWAAAGGGMRLAFAPKELAEARFDRTGVWEKGLVPHVYGVGGGRFTYRFPAPPGVGGRLTVRATMSSEWPGEGPGAARPDGGSRVVVRLDGKAIGAVAAITDDGRGAEVSVEARPGRLSPGPHLLAFEADEASHGLCLYGPEIVLSWLPAE